MPNWTLKPYESIDLAYRQEDDLRGRVAMLGHVEYVKAETGEVLRVTLESRPAAVGPDEARVDLLNVNREWTKLLSVPASVWWRDVTPGPFERGATNDTNRENMARIADGLLRRATKILAAASN